MKHRVLRRRCWCSGMALLVAVFLSPCIGWVGPPTCVGSGWRRSTKLLGEANDIQGLREVLQDFIKATEQGQQLLQQAQQRTEEQLQGFIQATEQAQQLQQQAQQLQQQAQKRTEEQLQGFIQATEQAQQLQQQAQQRTEEQLQRFIQATEQAQQLQQQAQQLQQQAQKRTEEQLQRFIQATEQAQQLQQAQKRTEKELQGFIQATEQAQELERIQKRTEKRLQKLTELLGESVDPSDRYWEDFDVTEAVRVGLSAKGRGCMDIWWRLGNKIPAYNGTIILEWDGLLYCPDERLLLCIESQTTVRDTHIDDLPRRLERMAAFLEGAQQWIDGGRPGTVSDHYRRVVDALQDVMGAVGQVDVAGVLGLLRAGSSKLGKKAMAQGIYLVLRPYGELVCPDEERWGWRAGSINSEKP